MFALKINAWVRRNGGIIFYNNLGFVKKCFFFWKKRPKILTFFSYVLQKKLYFNFRFSYYDRESIPTCEKNGLKSRSLFSFL